MQKLIREEEFLGQVLKFLARASAAQDVTLLASLKIDILYSLFLPLLSGGRRTQIKCNSIIYITMGA
jgi:hypothetical protein